MPDSSELPYAFRIMVALATPTVAILAVVIGFMQWYTAHRRVLLDLFEKRLSIYSDLKSLIEPFIRSGYLDVSGFRQFDEINNKARFLFGAEVIEYLQRLRAALIATEASRHDEEVSQSAEVKITDKSAVGRSQREMRKLFDDLPRILRKYLQMGIRSPW